MSNDLSTAVLKLRLIDLALPVIEPSFIDECMEAAISSFFIETRCLTDAPLIVPNLLGDLLIIFG